MLARGDATAFDAGALYGVERFDRIFVSYSLSMIPGWEKTVAAALAALAPGGSLHVVDFGQQEGLPRWFHTLLRGWLRKFHVAPRESLREVLESESRRTGAKNRIQAAVPLPTVEDRSRRWAVLTRPHDNAR